MISDENKPGREEATGGSSRPFEPRYDWSDVDWSLQDIIIAEMIGCSREMVRRKRQKLKKSASVNKGVKRRTPGRVDMVLGRSGPNGITVLEAAKTLEVGYVAAYRFMRRHGIRIQRDEGLGPKFSLMNWRLANQDLARIWRVRAVKNLRSRYGADETPMMTTRADLRDRMKNPAYVRMVRDEEEKAEKWFQARDARNQIRPGGSRR